MTKKDRLLCEKHRESNNRTMKRIFILFTITLLSLFIFATNSYAKGLTAEKFTEIIEKHNFKLNEKEI